MNNKDLNLLTKQGNLMKQLFKLMGIYRWESQEIKYLKFSSVMISTLKLKTWVREKQTNYHQEIRLLYMYVILIQYVHIAALTVINISYSV